MLLNDFGLYKVVMIHWSATLVRTFHEMILSTIKCRIELGTLFSLLCNLVCVNAFATLKMCVYRIEIFAKILRKKICKIERSEIFAMFFENFLQILRSYTHTFEVWQKHEHILNCIVAKTKYPVKSYT